MQQAIESYRRAIYHLNPKVTQDEWDYFESGFNVRTFKPREFYIEAGKLNHQLGFIASGLVRGYYLNEAGEDITTLFEIENGWVTDYPSLLVNKPSRYNFQCLEPTTIISVSFEHIRRGYDLYVGFERNGRLIAEDVLKKQQKRIESFQFDSAEERYLEFMRDNSSVFNRISLTHLASYLGIERPSLSRIRRNLMGHDAL